MLDLVSRSIVTELVPILIHIGGIAPNQVIARSEFEVHREIYTE